MHQTRIQSLVETYINTFIGFMLSFLAWPLAAGVCQLQYTSSQHFGVVLFFTLLSVLRGYVIRRFFNARLHNAAKLLSSKLV